MRIIDIIKYIEYRFPLNSQMDFDNSGANIINYNDKVMGILICLDITKDVIEYAYLNHINLIISHHPIIFNSLKKIDDDPLARRIKLLIKYGISAYSIHTNFDVNIKYGMGKTVKSMLFKNGLIKNEKLLSEFKVGKAKYGLGNIISLKKALSIDTIYNQISKTFSIAKDKMVLYLSKQYKSIKKLVIIPGSGSGEIDLVIKEKPDLLITSEVKHNQIIDLLQENISYINATHYGLEKVFVDNIYKFIKTKYKRNIYTYIDKNL